MLICCDFFTSFTYYLLSWTISLLFDFHLKFCRFRLSWFFLFCRLFLFRLFAGTCISMSRKFWLDDFSRFAAVFLSFSLFLHSPSIYNFACISLAFGCFSSVFYSLFKFNLFSTSPSAKSICAKILLLVSRFVSCFAAYSCIHLFQ